jgi:hypothetical protein
MNQNQNFTNIKLTTKEKIELKNSKATNFSDFLKKTDKEKETTYLGKKSIGSTIVKSQNGGENIIEKIKENLMERDTNIEHGDINYSIMMNFSNDGTEKEEVNKLYTYYCSLCGANVIVSDTMLESMPRRKTDESIIILISKIFFKSYLKRDKLCVIKRDTNKYEKQFCFVCQECGVLIAYQTIDYEEYETSDELKRRSNKIFSHNKKKILYVLIDAVVVDPRQSSLFIEMEKIKECQEKKVSFVRIKKTEVDENGKEKEKIVYL